MRRRRLHPYLRPFRITDVGSSGLAKASILGATGTVSQSVMRVLTNILIGRVAGPVALGVVSSALSLGNLLNLVWPSTAGNAAAKFIGRARGQNDRATLAAATAHIGKRLTIVTLALGLAALPLWILLDGGGLLDGVVVSLLIAGLAGNSFTRGVHFGLGQYGRATFWDVATGALGLAGVALVLIAGATGVLVLMPIALSYLVYTAACWPRGASGSLSRKLAREIDSFVVIGSIGTIASAGFLHSSLLVARTGWGADGAGQYAAALAIATPTALIARSISTALYPRMARDYGRGNEAQVAYVADRFSRLLTFLMVLILGSLALMRETVISVVWGAAFEDATALLAPLLLAVLFTSVRVPAVNYLSSGPSRGIKETTIFSIVGLLVGAVAWASGIAANAPLSVVAWGYLLGSVVTTCLTMGTMWKRSGLNWRYLTVRLALGVVGVGALMWVQRALNFAAWQDTIMAIAFSTVWLALSWKDIKPLTFR